MTTRLRDLDLDRHLADPAIKQQFVTPMFDLIAPSYDRFTRLFSYGMDAGWKRTLLAEARALSPAGTAALDLACGTGTVSQILAADGMRVTGVDISPEMIRVAREKKSKKKFQIRFEVY